jgi:hypothetical protein
VNVIFHKAPRKDPTLQNAQLMRPFECLNPHSIRVVLLCRTSHFATISIHVNSDLAMSCIDSMMTSLHRGLSGLQNLY